MRSSFDDNLRATFGEELAKDRVAPSVAQFKPIADGINRMIEQRVGDGDSIDDILNDANFDSFAHSLAMADAAVNREIQSIRNRIDLDQAEKAERIKHITSIAAEKAARDRFAIAQRQKEIEALKNSTDIYVRSLERMYQNMEQSIGAAQAALSGMNRQIELTTASLQGQAKIGEVILDSINVLQNPRAFNTNRVNRASTSAANIFGLSLIHI